MSFSVVSKLNQKSVAALRILSPLAGHTRAEAQYIQEGQESKQGKNRNTNDELNWYIARYEDCRPLGSIPDSV